MEKRFLCIRSRNFSVKFWKRISFASIPIKNKVSSLVVRECMHFFTLPEDLVIIRKIKPQRSQGITGDHRELLSSSLVPSVLTNYLFSSFSVPIFSYKVKDILECYVKLYCVDNWFIRVGYQKFSENLGRLADNIVFIDLK